MSLHKLQRGKLRMPKLGSDRSAAQDEE